MKKIAWLGLILLWGCQPIEEKANQLLIGLGLKSAPPVEVEPTVEQTYDLPKNPTMEEDLGVKMDERKSLFTLIDDFIQQPNSELRGMIVKIFPSFAEKNFLPQVPDSDLTSALNRLNQQLVAKNREHYLMLNFLVQELKGVHQFQAKQIFARGFEFAPYTMVDILSSSDQDQLCLLAKELNANLDQEEKKDIFTARYSSLLSIRELAKKEERLTTMLEACIATIKLELTGLNQVAPPAVSP
jgi:hypothetical protein